MRPDDRSERGGLPVRDKRGRAPGAPSEGSEPAAVAAATEALPSTAPPGDGGAPFDGNATAGAGLQEPAAPDEAVADAVEQAERYLDDLRRLQAEFDNYRKRMMRQQTALEGKATLRLVERLLPVLDDFDRALEHTPDSGFTMVRSQLFEVLAREGLEEVPAQGQPFDPTVHEAVELVDSAEVAEPVVTRVYRKGYRLAGAVLRPAMVAVARPVEVTGEPEPAGIAEADAPAAESSIGGEESAEESRRAPEAKETG